MNNSNRTVWIVVAVVVALLLCCCVLVVGVAVAGLLAAGPLTQGGGIGRVEERTEQIITVGEAPMLEVDNFAGDLVVFRGEDEQMRIIATKRANSSSRLDQITVAISEREEGVRIEASHPGMEIGNVSVRFEIYMPADAQVDLHTGAGNVQTADVEGKISVHTGAGNVRVQGAAAPVTLEAGAGEIDYEGQPQGTCTFDNGAGNITLRLPEDVNVDVELTTGIGNVNVTGYDVDGQVSGTEVNGVIGTGEDATIRAHTGVGNVALNPR